MCKEKALVSLTHIIKTFENIADVRQIKTLLSKHFLDHLTKGSRTRCPRQLPHPEEKKTDTVQSILKKKKKWSRRDGRRMGGGQPPDAAPAPLGGLRRGSDAPPFHGSPSLRDPGSRGSSGSREKARSRTHERGATDEHRPGPEASLTNA